MRQRAKRRVWKGLGLSLVAISLFLALGLAAAWVERTSIAQWAARSVAEAYGAPAPEFTVSAFTLTELRMTSITLGPEAAADEIRVRWSPRAILGPQPVASVVVERPRLDLTVTETGLRDAVARFLAAPAQARKRPLTPPEISIRGAVIRVPTPEGPVRLDGDAMILATGDGGVQFTANARGDTPAGPITLATDISLAPSGAVSGSAGLDAAALSVAGMAAREIDLKATLAGNTADAINVAARLRAGSLDGDFGRAERIEATLPLSVSPGTSVVITLTEDGSFSAGRVAAPGWSLPRGLNATLTSGPQPLLVRDASKLETSLQVSLDPLGVTVGTGDRTTSIDLVPGRIDINATLGTAPGAVAIAATVARTKVTTGAPDGPVPAIFITGDSSFDGNVLGANAEITSEAGSGATRVAATLPIGAPPVLAIRFEAFDFQVGALGIGGLDGGLRLSPLVPPRTDGAASLKAVLSVPAVPLGPASIDFSVVDGTAGMPAIRIARMAIAAADGTLALADTVYDLGRARNGLEIAVDDLDLAVLFAAADVEGLSGEGRLSGRLPVRISSEGVAIENAVLADETGGRIRFRSAAASQALAGGGEQVALLMRALADFQYDRIRLEVDRNVAGNVDATLRLEGSNPAVLEGHPFIININVESNLDKLISTVVESMALTDRALRATISPLR